MELKIIPVVQVLIAATLMAIITKLSPHYLYVFHAKNTLAVVVLIIAVFIGLLAIINFRHHKTTVNPSCPEKASKVVNTGIYAYSRNPMYLALVLALLTFAVYLSHLLAFIVIPFFIAYITKYQIKPEERALISLFGQAFTDYMSKVRRWF